MMVIERSKFVLTAAAAVYADDAFAARDAHY